MNFYSSAINAAYGARRRVSFGPHSNSLTNSNLPELMGEKTPAMTLQFLHHISTFQMITQFTIILADTNT